MDENAANSQEGLAAAQALRNQIGQTYHDAAANDLRALRKNRVSVANVMGAKLDPSMLDSASSDVSRAVRL